MQEQYVIIVAGGVGTRMKSDLPKQFIEIAGIPVIIRTIRCFLKYNPQIRIVISVHKNYQAYLQELIEKFELSNSKIRITIGGDSRFASVKNGLSLVDDQNAVVGIHDAARPFASLQTIKNCYETAAEQGTAVPAISVKDSLRKINASENRAVNRGDYKIIQTPQCFLVSKLKKAFEQEDSPDFTDDATVLETLGEKIILVEGNEENIKITSPYDLFIANVLVNHE